MTLVVTYEQSTNLPLFLEIVSSSKSVDAAGFLHISGKIRNSGSGIAHETKVAATLYDSGGKVVDAAMSYCDPTDIAVGTRLASFEIITLEKTRVTLVDSYTLYAQSIEYSTVEYGVVPEFAATFLLLPIVVLLALIVTRRRAIRVDNVPVG